MSYNEGKKAFDTSAAVEAKRLLILAAAGTVSHNDATSTNQVIGVSDYAAGSGEVVGTTLLNYGGTVEMTAAGAITAGVDVFAAADGKIQALPAGAADYRKIGMAIEAATADGDAIEVMPYDTPTIVTVT